MFIIYTKVAQITAIDIKGCDRLFSQFSNNSNNNSFLICTY